MSTDPLNQKPKEPEKNKLNEALENLKKNNNLESLISYAQNNTRDTISYVLLILGLVWMLFSPFSGGILVGLVGGFYFSKEILAFVMGFNSYVEEQGMAKALVLGGLGLAIFIATPGIFIGMAIMAGIRFLLKME